MWHIPDITDPDSITEQSLMFRTVAIIVSCVWMVAVFGYVLVFAQGAYVPDRDQATAAFQMSQSNAQSLRDLDRRVVFLENQIQILSHSVTSIESKLSLLLWMTTGLGFPIMLLGVDAALRYVIKRRLEAQRNLSH